MAKEKVQIIKKHLIMCEGLDEFKFLVEYLNNPTLSLYPGFANDIQVYDFGGNEELDKIMRTLIVTPNFDKLESLLVMRDAEKDANTAVSQIQSALRKAGLPIPDSVCQWKPGNPKTGFLLFPNCSDVLCNGTLEDLCLDIIKESQTPDIITTIDNFLDTMATKHQRSFPHRFKTKLHTYFSVTDKYVGLKIGEAARAGAFDWGSDRLNPMTAFIQELFNGI